MLVKLSIILIYLKFFKKDTNLVMNETSVVEEKVYSSNIIENVNYSTKDNDGKKSLKNFSSPTTVHVVEQIPLVCV